MLRSPLGQSARSFRFGKRPPSVCTHLVCSAESRVLRVPGPSCLSTASHPALSSILTEQSTPLPVGSPLAGVIGPWPRRRLQGKAAPSQSALGSVGGTVFGRSPPLRPGSSGHCRRHAAAPSRFASGMASPSDAAEAAVYPALGAGGR